MSKAQFLADNLNPGETYAGLMLAEKEGERDYHLFIRPGEGENLTLEQAKEWAKKAGGDLPTRREQRVLFANAKAEFKPEIYWSGETTSDGRYAFVQGFGSGSQDHGGLTSEFRVRAVSRLFL